MCSEVSHQCDLISLLIRGGKTDTDRDFLRLYFLFRGKDLFRLKMISLWASGVKYNSHHLSEMFGSLLIQSLRSKIKD